MSYSTVMPNDMNSGYSEMQHMVGMRSILNRVPYRFEHPGRDWESSVALNALRKNGCKTVLEIGGGGSLFAPAAAWVDLDVTVLDPYNAQPEIDAQNKATGKPVKFINERLENYKTGQSFDAVLALSVIEHVDDDENFIRLMSKLVRPGGLLVITTDFHPSGKPLVDGHIRTYNEKSLLEMAKLTGFEFYGGKPDYSTMATAVFGKYSFASLVLQRPEDKKGKSK